MPKKPPAPKLMSGQGKTQLVGLVRVVARAAAREEYERHTQSQADERKADVDHTE